MNTSELIFFVNEQIKKQFDSSNESNSHTTKSLSKFSTPFIPQVFRDWKPQKNLFELSYFLFLQKIPSFFIEKYQNLSKSYDTTKFFIPILDLEYFSYCKYMQQYTKYDATIDIVHLWDMFW